MLEELEVSILVDDGREVILLGSPAMYGGGLDDGVDLIGKLGGTMVYSFEESTAMYGDGLDDGVDLVGKLGGTRDLELFCDGCLGPSSRDINPG